MQSSLLTSRVYEYAARNGWLVVDKKEEADAYIVLPCVFDGLRLDVVRDKIGGALRSTADDVPVIAVGCWSELDEVAVEERVEVVPHKELSKLDEVLEAEVAIKEVRTNLLNVTYRSTPEVLDSFAWNIDLGNTCVNNCAYCNIKRAKGKDPGQSLEQVLEDVKRGVDLGHKTLFLLGDDAGSWGVGQGKSLSDLLYGITEVAPEVRLRFDYIHPRMMLKHFEALRDSAVAGNFEFAVIPIQHTVPRLLKLMNRRYDASEVLDKLAALKEAAPGVMVLNHMMLAYPTETREEFFEGLKVGESAYDRNLYFTFHPHPNTPAWEQHREHGISPEEIAWRSERVVGLRSPRVTLCGVNPGETFKVMHGELRGGWPAEAGSPEAWTVPAAEVEQSAPPFPAVVERDQGERRPKPRLGLVRLRRGGAFATPTYGIATMARYLGDHTDATVSLAELAISKGEDRYRIPDFLLDVRQLEIICFTVDSDAADLWPAVYWWLTHLLKKGDLCRDLLVALMGAYPTQNPTDALRWPGTVFVLGEGEETLAELVRAYGAGVDAGRIAGIAYAGDGELRTNAARPYLEAASIPTPLVNNGIVLDGEYQPLRCLSERVGLARVGQVRTSRGGALASDGERAVFGESIRRKPMEVVARELAGLVDIGASEVIFSDPSLLSDRDYFRALMEEIARMDLQVPLSFVRGMTAGSTTPADLEAAYAAGGRHVCIPFPEERASADAAIELWREARELGFLVETELRFARPGASESDLAGVVEALSSSEVEGIVLLPYPDDAAAASTSCPAERFAALRDELVELSRARIGADGLTDKLGLFGLRPNPGFLAEGAAYLERPGL